MIYGNNRAVALEAANIEADMSYGVDSCGRMLMEAKQNDFALFTGIITNDIECCLTEDAAVVQAIEEASVKGIWDSIVSIFEKLIAKIKGLFQTFMAKLSANAKDTQKLYKKYNGTIRYKDLTGFKMKARQFNADAYSKVSDFKGDELSVMVSKAGDVSGEGSETKIIDAVKGNFPEVIISACDEKLSNMDEAFDKTCFAEEKEMTFTGSEVADSDWIGGLLNTTAADAIKNLKKANAEVEKALAKQLAEAKKRQKYANAAIKKGPIEDGEHKGMYADSKTNGMLNKNMTGEGPERDKIKYGTKEDFEKASKDAGNAVSVMSKYQTVLIAYNSARLDTIKKAITQAKKIFAGAAAYKASKKEEKKAEETAKEEGFVLNNVDYSILYEMYGEESYLEAAFMAEAEVNACFS